MNAILKEISGEVEIHGQHKRMHPEKLGSQNCRWWTHISIHFNKKISSKKEENQDNEGGTHPPIEKELIDKVSLHSTLPHNKFTGYRGLERTR